MLKAVCLPIIGKRKIFDGEQEVLSISIFVLSDSSVSFKLSSNFLNLGKPSSLILLALDMVMAGKQCAILIHFIIEQLLLLVTSYLDGGGTKWLEFLDFWPIIGIGG